MILNKSSMERGLAHGTIIKCENVNLRVKSRTPQKPRMHESTRTHEISRCKSSLIPLNLLARSIHSVIMFLQLSRTIFIAATQCHRGPIEREDIEFLFKQI